MPDLRAFQNQFGAALASGPSATPASAGDPAMARALAVHRNTSAKAAHDALAANYPVVHALVGTDAFLACADGYVGARSPREPRLCDYGDRFASYVGAYAPFSDLPYLTDVARLERLCIEALFAADAPVLNGAAFAAGIEPHLRLTPHPAVRTASFDYPAVSLWRAHQDDAAADALETVAWRAETALVTRPGDSLEVIAIDATVLAFLTACEADQPLGDAAIAASKTGGDLAAAFATLIGAGAFTSMTL